MFIAASFPFLSDGSSHVVEQASAIAIKTDDLKRATHACLIVDLLDVIAYICMISNF